MCLVASGVRAQTPVPEAAAFLPRLSDAAEAMEYWDVTAQLDSGHRFFARFLITNEGPGAHTAAAVGHLVQPDGSVVPIKYGRTRGGWMLGPDRKRLKVASAVLDLSDPLWRVEFDSNRYGFKVLLHLTRAAAPISSAPLPGEYWVDVVPPTSVGGTIWLRGMDAPVPVEGTVALTHTRMERNEADLIVRRAELFGSQDGVGIYLSDLTLAEGGQRATLIAREGEGPPSRSEELQVTFGAAVIEPGDPHYPVPVQWSVDRPGVRADVRVGREWLRWEPLDIVPQPFRFLLALRVAPQLVWGDAEYDVRLSPGGDAAPIASSGRGVALVAFARQLPGS